MDPVHPWVDPSEMRRLAESLLLAPAKAPEAPEGAGFGGDFVGYAGPATSPTHKTSQVPADPIVIPSSMTAQALGVATRHIESEDTLPNLEIVSPAVWTPAFLESPNSTVRPTSVEQSVVFSPYQSSVSKTLTSETSPAPQIEPVNPAPTAAVPFLTMRSEEKSMQERIAEAALRAQQIAPITHTPPQPPLPVVSSPTPPAPLPHLQATRPAQVSLQTATVPQDLTLKIHGPFIERTLRFLDGLHAQFGSKGVFILDKEGSVIFDESDHSRLHFMARSLATAPKKHNAGPGNFHVKVGSTTMLEVIPVDTAFGRIVLGLLVEKALSSEAIIHIIQALKSAVAPPQH